MKNKIFASGTDTIVILELIEIELNDFVESLRGIIAVAPYNIYEMFMFEIFVEKLC